MLARFGMLTALFAAAVVGCAATGEVMDRGEWSEAEDCPDILFVGIRGSGQDPGMGPQLTDVYERFLEMLAPDRDVEVAYHGLDYPAGGSLTGGATPYSDSVAVGVRELPTAVEAIELACDKARIVLGGYSQGAHVIAISDHAFLEQSNVDAVVLLANPVFEPEDATEKVGTFSSEQGGIIRNAWIDGPISERTIQVCLAGDPICQFGSIAFWVHSNNYFGEVLDPLAEFAAEKVVASL